MLEEIKEECDNISEVRSTSDKDNKNDGNSTQFRQIGYKTTASKP